MDPRDQLNALLAQNRVVLVTGPTGCGKSTSVPLWILDYLHRQSRLHNSNASSGILPSPLGCTLDYDQVSSTARILCCQPRRIAAKSLCEYLETQKCREFHQQGICERNYSDEIGYMVALDSHNKEGRLIYCTTGLLLARLKMIHEFQFVLLDEVHERVQESEVLIAAMQRVLRKNKTLRLIIMSATISPADMQCYTTTMFRDFISADENPILTLSTSYPHPIKTAYLDTVPDDFPYSVAEHVLMHFQDEDRRPKTISQLPASFYLIGQKVERNGTLYHFRIPRNGPPTLAKDPYRLEATCPFLCFGKLLLLFLHRNPHRYSWIGRRSPFLVFVPGLGQIFSLMSFLRANVPEREIEIIPMHSSLRLEELRAATCRPADGAGDQVFAAPLFS